MTNEGEKESMKMSQFEVRTEADVEHILKEYVELHGLNAVGFDPIKGHFDAWMKIQDTMFWAAEMLMQLNVECEMSMDEIEEEGMYWMKVAEVTWDERWNRRNEKKGKKGK